MGFAWRAVCKDFSEPALKDWVNSHKSHNHLEILALLEKSEGLANKVTIAEGLQLAKAEFQSSISISPACFIPDAFSLSSAGIVYLLSPPSRIKAPRSQGLCLVPCCFFFSLSFKNQITLQLDCLCFLF